jgi:outer membrane protein assembly factor BamB
MYLSSDPTQRFQARHAITRRRLLMTSSAAVAMCGLSARRPLFAQEEATPGENLPEVEPGTPAATPEAALPAVPPEFTDNETNWPVEGGNLSATREAQGSGISSDTVAELGLAWTLPVTGAAAFGSLVANPIVVGDTVYIQDGLSNVYAVNKETGEEIWFNEYNDEVPTGGPNGVAVGYGLVVIPLGNVGDVVAVDAATGEEVWRTNISGPLGEGITSAPLIYDSNVIISTVPGNLEAFYQPGQRGVIHALDIRDGAVVWYFDTTTDNLWGNSRVNSGGGLWHPPSVDDDGNLYVGVGNAAPFPGNEAFPGGSSYPGDNDYANSLVRINPDTGGVDWYINVTGHNFFDHDNQLTPMHATVTMDGAERPVVFSSGKHGYILAVDPETGEELWRTAVGQHNENESLQELGPDESVEVLPGMFGGLLTPFAYANGMIFAPVMNLPFTVNGVEGTTSGGDFIGPPDELVAVDAATGEIAWSVEIPTMLVGGATVANDVVFTGGLDGVVRGFSVDDGTLVFTYQAAAGINASFAVSGEYLFVPAGYALAPSEDTADPPPEQQFQLIALEIGGDVQATPSS